MLDTPLAWHPFISGLRFPSTVAREDQFNIAEATVSSSQNENLFHCFHRRLKPTRTGFSRQRLGSQLIITSHCILTIRRKDSSLQVYLIDLYKILLCLVILRCKEGLCQGSVKIACLTIQRATNYISTSDEFWDPQVLILSADIRLHLYGLAWCSCLLIIWQGYSSISKIRLLRMSAWPLLL